MVARVRLIECAFELPVRRSTDGKRNGRAQWEWLDRGLHGLAKEIRPAPIHVYFTIDSKTKKRLGACSVALPRRHVRRVRSLLTSACAVFGQEQICLSVAGHVEYVQGART